ncbi:unnamed protein product [Adineta ricciae]|uniref:Uncharacterized protein n=1 Tax=Adineta ricciae TaxID=249248 RepID=A0A815SGX2_ADIRI|nr:unnamed protein product [Adineta ricciae]
MHVVTSLQVAILDNRMYATSNYSLILFNQTRLQCICNAFADNSSSIVLLNFYANASRCELFDHYPMVASMLVATNNSTIIMRPYNVSSQTDNTTTWLNNATSTTSTTSMTSSTTIRTTTSTTSTISMTTRTTTTSSTTTTTNQTPTQLWNVSNDYGLVVAYQNYYFSWTALTTRNATIAFRMQNAPSSWCLDDVSVTSGGVEKLINGGFETGILSPWVRTTPNGNCNGIAASTSNTNNFFAGLIPRTGSYYIVDGSSSCADQLQQSFGVTIGTVYNISFWIKAVFSLNSGQQYVGVSVI